MKYVNENPTQTEIAMCEYHCLSDVAADKHLDELVSANVIDAARKDRVKILFQIMKDADALDRVRFGMGNDGLDVKFLRLAVSPRLIPVAHVLLQYNTNNIVLQ